MKHWVILYFTRPTADLLSGTAGSVLAKGVVGSSSVVIGSKGVAEGGRPSNVQQRILLRDARGSFMSLQWDHGEPVEKLRCDEQLPRNKSLPHQHRKPGLP